MELHRLGAGLALGLATITAAPFAAQESPAAPTAPATPTVDAPAGALALATQLEQLFAAVGDATLPSVVSIRCYERAASDAPAGKPDAGWLVEAEPAYPGFRLVSGGSGFVVERSGEILSSLSVLQSAPGRMPDLIEVETRDGSRILAELIGSEPTVNLAILQCVVFPNGHAGELPPLPFGDSDVMRLGQWAFGVGDPVGPDRFFAPGTFITPPSRDCYQDLLSATFMQVAMNMHPLAAGGPVVDLQGRVIGILQPRAERGTGVALALPSKIAQGLYEAIRVVRSNRSPWLGIAVMSRAEIAAQRGIEHFNALDKPRHGILIENVFQPSPAHAAGLRPGDWLVGLGSTRIYTPVDFQKALYLTGIGNRAALELYRDGTTLRADLAIEQRPAAAAPR